MISSNPTSIPCLMPPTNQLLTKMHLKTTNQTKLLSKHLSKIMSHLLSSKREETLTKRMMMKRWSKKTKIMRKRQKMWRMPMMKKRLRTTKRSKSKKKRARLKLVKKRASKQRRSLKINHLLNSCKITQKVNKSQNLHQREGGERASFQRHQSSR